jgi:sulfur carrier protein ThiS
LKGTCILPIRLILAATLRKYVPGYKGETGYEASVEPGTTVADLARLLRIPEEEVALIMIDGITAGKDAVLTGNERVALFPAVGGG